MTHRSLPALLAVLFPFLFLAGCGGGGGGDSTEPPSNSLPSAVDDDVVTMQGTAILIEVLNNGSDPDDNPLQLDAIEQVPTNGSDDTPGSTTLSFRQDPQSVVHPSSLRSSDRGGIDPTYRENDLGSRVLADAALPRTTTAMVQQENVLIIVADDLGIDLIRAYGFKNSQGDFIAPLTPNIDQLAASGVLFRNAWAAPACSTSRSSALTGRYPNRVGVGAAIGSNASGPTGLRADFTLIPDLLPAAYRKSIIGKWHVAGDGPLGALTQGLDHAPRCGFDFHLGTFGNLGVGNAYFDWLLLFAAAGDPPGVREAQIAGPYVTTATANHALRTIKRWGDSPWLLWVAFHAPHKPFHVPPAHLFNDASLDLDTELGQGKAMVEALDTEIGRLLDSIDPSIMARTTIVFYGDNGTQKSLVQAPFQPSRAKGTVYNGGVHVPLIVKSPRTPVDKQGSECLALTDVTDLLPTVSELCGVVSPFTTDGTSVVPYLKDPAIPSIRPWIFAEKFKPNFVPDANTSISTVPLLLHHQTVRDERYKLVRKRSVTGGLDVVQLYDLQVDYFEIQNLLNAQGQPPVNVQANFDRLMTVVDAMLQ